MTVGELRKRLAPFDDETEIFAAPETSAKVVGEDRETAVPHPKFHHKIKEVNIVADRDANSLEITKRYVVLAYDIADRPNL